MSSPGVPLGHVLDICGVSDPRGVLVGGYHGLWLSAETAYGVTVSRAGLADGGGTLGAGVVLVLGPDTCPIGEVARIAGYLATQSAGQCGPCKLGLPAIARSLAAIASGAGTYGRSSGTESGAIQAVRLCIERGVDVNAARDNGQTALHSAAGAGGDPQRCRAGAPLCRFNGHGLYNEPAASGACLATAGARTHRNGRPAVRPRNDGSG